MQIAMWPHTHLKMKHLKVLFIATVIVLVALFILPFILSRLGKTGEFWIWVTTEMIIMALFAMSLNLILGFGGMVSFGHAAFIGVGAYAVAM